MYMYTMPTYTLFYIFVLSIPHLKEWAFRTYFVKQTFRLYRNFTHDIIFIEVDALKTVQNGS